MTNIEKAKEVILSNISEILDYQEKRKKFVKMYIDCKECPIRDKCYKDISGGCDEMFEKYGEEEYKDE